MNIQFKAWHKTEQRFVQLVNISIDLDGGVMCLYYYNSENKLTENKGEIELSISPIETPQKYSTDQFQAAIEIASKRIYKCHMGSGSNFHEGIRWAVKYFKAFPSAIREIKADWCTVC